MSPSAPETKDPRALAGEAIAPEVLQTQFAMGSPNPFMPIGDIQVAQDMTAITCPTDFCRNRTGETRVFLHPVSQNDQGDILLICGNIQCGYETVYRVGTRTFEPRPGRPDTAWQPPVTKSGVKGKVKASKKTKAPCATRAPKPEGDKPLTLSEAAKQINVPLRSLRRAVRKKKLRALKHDGEYHVNPADLAAYQQELS